MTSDKPEILRVFIDDYLLTLIKDDDWYTSEDVRKMIDIARHKFIEDETDGN